MESTKSTSPLSSDLYFLTSNGEMAELMRSKDWSKTTIGNPAEWPHSLKTMVSVILNNPIGMYIVWGNEHIQLYNDAFRPILGTTKHPQALGISSSETFSEIWETIGPMFDGVMKGTPVRITDFMVFLNRDGYFEDCYFDFSYSPIPKENGETGGILVTVIETTQQKKAEKGLKENEHLLTSVINSAPFPIGVYVGKEMKIEIANQAILNAWGKGNDVIGKSYIDILPELGNQAIFQQLDDVLTTGIPFHAKNQRVDIVVDDKLQPYYFNYSFTPLYDTSGNIYGVMNTAADVTDLNNAKIKVQESERSLRQTILQAPVAMCILRGPKYIVELANDRMYELWGRSAEALLGKPVFEGLEEATNQGFEDLLKGVYTTGVAFVAEGIPVRLPRNGRAETIFINVVYEAYREALGDISGILVVAVDVTQQVIARQKIEEVVENRTKELADANKNLQKSNAELAQFAYIASHDLQEPLRKISNFTQMLENRIENNIDEQSRNYLQKINNASTRMHTLIRDVLTYSELVKDSETFELVDLNQVMKSVLMDYELAIEQKEASIRFNNLCVIEAIPLQMSQLFGNMLSNSLKFSKKEIKPIISISAFKLMEEEKTMFPLDQSLNYIKIEFRDNGIGFQQEHEEKIFNIFQRLHRKSEYEGTGIGLAMCKKIVLNHHGHLNTTGSSENGAVFNVILPEKQSH